MLHFMVTLFIICFVWLTPPVVSDIIPGDTKRCLKVEWPIVKMNMQDVLHMCHDKLGHVGCNHL